MTILVLRLSSLGNVAMTVPVIASLSKRYPEHRFIVVAKKPLGAMFYGLSNVVYHEAHLRHGEGIRKLWRELKNEPIDLVVDLQNVWRTRLLSLLWRLSGVRCVTIRYGRTEKIWLRLRGHKHHPALKSEFERYRETFSRAGLESGDEFVSMDRNEAAREQVRALWGDKTGRWIGIAPFAKSKSNMLPYRITKELILDYAMQPDTRVMLFGAGQIEIALLQQWANLKDNIICVAGQIPLEQELELMRQLDVMICMDSANQHLSSLVGLRAVSVWCGTHPHSGFLGWKQKVQDIVQVQQLSCRPCTIHGTNRCRYRNFACREVSKLAIEKVVAEN